MGNSEEPWYTPMILAFLSEDVPRILGIPQGLFARDVTTLAHRVRHEGESFFTKTLPSLGKAIDLALQGTTPLMCTSFKKRGRTALPAFLSALLRRVFTDDGYVRDIPCVTSIRLLRQITMWCKKLEKGYSDESLQKAVDDFVSVDASLPSCEGDMPNAGRLLAVARAIVERIFRNVDSPTTVAPAHGPGSVADAAGPIRKRIFGVRYTDLEKWFRPIPWFFSLRDASECYTRITNRIKRQFGLDKVMFVNKDSSGPRTIGLAPAAYMWCQQALKTLMYHHIEKVCRLTRGRVNFTNQLINRSFALLWQLYDTLDMSKASDRNSLALFKALWRNTPLYGWLLASRTPGAVLPDGRVLMYKKFAPMGSAVCFPVQAVTYYALACAALHLSGMPLLLACRKVYVYGDDLIVPHGFSAVLYDAFEAVGLKFNADKCCTDGKFRESCGCDAYDGIEVTPVRFRKDTIDDDYDVVRLVEHAHSLAQAGYWSSAGSLERASKAKYKTLMKKLRLRHSPERLPILTWPTLGASSVELSFKDQQSYACGWSYVPDKEISLPELEMFHLREGLTRVGPVGVDRGGGVTARSRPRSKRWVSAKIEGEEICCVHKPVVDRRAFAAKYRGKLRRKAVQLELPLVRTTPLQKELELWAVGQGPIELATLSATQLRTVLSARK